MEKLAVVLWALTLPKVTGPGPLTLDHVRVNVPAAGKPYRGGAIQGDRRRKRNGLIRAGADNGR